MRTDITDYIFNKFDVEVLSTSKDLIACVSRSGYNKFTIELNEKIRRVRNSNLSSALELHECGHIYYNHILNAENSMEALKDYLAEHQYEIGSKIHLKSKVPLPICHQSVEKLINSDALIHKVLNIAGDFQIHAGLFSYKEFLDMSNDLSECMDKVIEGYHPKDHGITEIDSFTYYVTETLKILPEIIAEEFHRSVEVVKDPTVIHQVGKEFENWIDEQIQATYSLNPGIGKDTKSVEVTKVDVIHYFNELVASSKTIDWSHKKNYSHNYNRKKFGSDLLIPKIQSKLRTTTNRVHLALLIDVSVSVPMEYINQVLSDLNHHIISHNKNFEYEVILWNTGLVQHLPVRKGVLVDTLHTGGGTSIYKSFKYLKDKLDDDCNLVIFSDFEDNLDLWKSEEHNLSNYKVTAFDYGDVIHKIPWDHIKYNKLKLI